MKKTAFKRKLLMGLGGPVLFALAWLLPLDIVLAQGGFVPCDGVDCGSCELVYMVNEIIKWLFGIAAMIFGVIMAVAGFGLVTSGGNQSALAAAKSKFGNAIVGLIIMMSAWLLIDILMRGLLPGNEGKIDGRLFWADVECTRQTDTVPFYDLNTGAGGEPTDPGREPVPGATEPSACSIAPLTALTDDLAVAMEKGNAVIFRNDTLKQCAEKFVAAVGGGARVTSAYRPQQYQQHLWEIRDRWCTKNLRNNTEAACVDLKTAIGAEVSRHFGATWSCGSVAQNSRHTQDTAVDVDIGGITNHADARVRKAAEDNCLIWQNYPGDPWHYDLRAGCSCN